MDNGKRSVLMQRFEIGKFLGQGNFAKVYQARNIRTGDNVAIKVIDKGKVREAGLMDQIKREISITSSVKHPNIVELYEVMATKTKVYIVMEYVKGGELFKKITKGRFKEQVARKYFRQLISAIDYCHSKGVFHRDLKPENLLLDENGNLKISDFGLSASADYRRQDGLLHTACGTPSYVSPEVISRKGYDGAKSDIWSCGVILFVLLAGYLPFHDANLIEIYRKIKKAEFKCPRWFPSEVRRLLSKILDPNPATRISAGKIMENSWFRRGFASKLEKTEAEPTVTQMADDEILSSGDDVPGAKETMKMTNLNAFDIISLASGLELSGLFEDADRKIEKKFTSKETASTIVSKLEDVSKSLKFNVMKKGGFLKLQRSKEGRKGAVAIDAEIFQITPDFHLVEMRKSSGDSLEYQKMWKQDIRPSLKDIVWAWQGETREDVQERNGQQ